MPPKLRTGVNVQVMHTPRVSSKAPVPVLIEIGSHSLVGTGRWVKVNSLACRMIGRIPGAGDARAGSMMRHDIDRAPASAEVCEFITYLCRHASGNA